MSCTVVNICFRFSQVPPKPLVKEQTKPEGFKLLTDVRAIERAEFDGYVGVFTIHTLQHTVNSCHFLDGRPFEVADVCYLEQIAERNSQVELQRQEEERQRQVFPASL